MSELVTLTKDRDIGILTINNPPVNALSPGVPEGILAGIQHAAIDPSIQGIVLIGGGRTFIAGADIREFGKMTSGQKKRDVGLQPMLQALEDCPKPVVCAIHGTAFGGGLETAMSCHYRVAVGSAQVGQPEVKLGLIPGAGGTQRLPRLVGAAKAAQLCATGEPISAAEAFRAGLIDKLIEGELLPGAIAFAREVAAKGGPPRKTRDLSAPLRDRQANLASLATVRESVQKRARGLMAPFKAIEAVEAAVTLPFAEGLKKEAELFNECLFSEQSKALIHVFFGEREVAKIPGLPKDTPIRPIKKAAVVGGGTMGAGITMTYANAGIPVLLKEASQELVDRCLERIKNTYAASVQKGRLTQQQMDQRLALIQPTVTYERFPEADIVVEAVFEEMALKKKVFAELDKVTRPNAILASNTSTLDIDQIAAATTRPQRVIGNHFFSPANVMRLLEIVRGRESGHDVIATSMALAKTLGKIGVLVGNCYGFVGNRMFHCYQREAQFLLEEGASVEQVDRALTDFGLAMGPLAVGDLAGLDVGWRIRKEHRHQVPKEDREPLVADRLCEMGRFGQKTGRGWYRYEEATRRAIPDPDVEQLITECARQAGIARRRIANEEILERTLYALINEGAKILEEGIALRAVDIDIIYINGYGFPAYRGGPMWYAGTVGLDRILERIRSFEKQHGSLWKPAALLERLGATGKTFSDFDREKSTGT
ncbi:MAG TPA: 3-hydroxyacyl-CoA dehydrogenase NAD-binding domain-containing protein [Gemmataceae bacterium]|nr:3-hydroxyacyl-CoA dehydrogenase NAD-binding domain-containing protein [Gemmataceae bacterium]